MIFINALIFIISSGSAYLARFAIYTNIYTAITFPTLLKGQNKYMKFLVMMTVLSLYFIFWYIEITSTPNLYNFNWIFE